MPLCGVGYEFRDVVLGIVSVLISRCKRSHFRQLRICLDLDPPALVVGQVEMEGVELHQCQQVDVSFQFIFGPERPGRIQQISTPLEPWPILNRHAGDDPFPSLDGLPPLDLWWKQLTQGLDTVEDPAGGRCGNRDALWRANKQIALLTQIPPGIVKLQNDSPGRHRPRRRDLQFESGCWP